MSWNKSKADGVSSAHLINTAITFAFESCGACVFKTCYKLQQLVPFCWNSHIRGGVPLVKMDFKNADYVRHFRYRIRVEICAFNRLEKGIMYILYRRKLPSQLPQKIKAKNVLKYFCSEYKHLLFPLERQLRSLKQLNLKI